jgi:hypothetical protein
LAGGIFYYRSLPREAASNPDSVQDLKETAELDVNIQASSRPFASTQALTPQPDLLVQTPPANSLNWKTYTSAKYGYSIMYPDNFKYESRDEEEIYNMSQNKAIIHLDSWTTPESKVSIYIYPDGASTGLQFYAKTQSEGLIEIASQKVTKKVGIEIDSEKGTLIHIEPVKNKGLNYMFIYGSGNQMATTESLAVFDKILSTFKFTN